MNTHPRWKRLFVVVEVLLLSAIPLLAYGGFRTLLDSRTGTFVEDLGPTSPGWVALVDPSPVVGVVEVDDGQITGIAVAVGIGQTARGGAVVLVPASLEVVPGQPVGALDPESAVEAVASALRIRIPQVEVVDAARWETVLADSSYLMENPDPVPAADGGVMFAVGPVEVSGGGAAAFLGRTADGRDSLASLVRRELFWSRLLDNPPGPVDDPLSRTIRSIAAGPHEVVQAPIVRSESGAPVMLPERAEALVRRVVAFPAGDQADGRFRVRIEDRTGEADLDAVARLLGRAGVEVVSISNGAQFDRAPTAWRVEQGFTATERLQAELPGAPVQPDVNVRADDPLVLQLGPDHLSVITAWAE